MSIVPSSRRDILGFAAAAYLTPADTANAQASGATIKAVAFDGFPIFDPRPIRALTQELYPAGAAELSTLWTTRQFEYTWLRTLTGRYADFEQVTRDALVFACKALNLDLTLKNQTRLLGAYHQFRCWPDVPQTLAQLRDAGVRIAFLSNLTSRMLSAGLKQSRLDSYFDHILTTDRVKVYKPHPAAYQMAIDAFGFKKSEILFAAFAGWDVAGAKAFGYPTFWVNRLDSPAEELGTAADGWGRSLPDLVKFVRG